MRLLIANGLVVTEDGVRPRDIVCEDQVIVAVAERGAPVEADEILDATGKLVFPGFIDPHVHSRDPGLTEKEDFSHSTLAALRGGITTVIEMPNSVPPVDTPEAFRERRRHLERAANVDFAMWAMALATSVAETVSELSDLGAVGFKLFWGYALSRETLQLVYNLPATVDDAFIMPPDAGSVHRLFRIVGAVGGVLAAHCESREILSFYEKELGRPIRDYSDFLFTRPAVAESAAIALACEFAADTNCRFHVVHMSSQAGADTVRAAKARGLKVTAETCPQYLTLTDKDYDRVGPRMKVYPPIRTETDREALWRALDDGVVDSIGSDHAPHTAIEKGHDLATQPAGAVGCETLVPVMLDAVFKGRSSIERAAEVMSTNTAKLFGLFPRKGVIRVGSDADLTIVDPKASWTVRDAELASKHPVSMWDGVELQGLPVAVVLRGTVVMRDRNVMDSRNGRFIAANHGART